MYIFHKKAVDLVHEVGALNRGYLIKPLLVLLAMANQDRQFVANVHKISVVNGNTLVDTSVADVDNFRRQSYQHALGELRKLQRKFAYLHAMKPAHQPTLWDHAIQTILDNGWLLECRSCFLLFAPEQVERIRLFPADYEHIAAASAHQIPREVKCLNEKTFICTACLEGVRRAAELIELPVYIGPTFKHNAPSAVQDLMLTNLQRQLRERLEVTIHKSRSVVTYEQWAMQSPFRAKLLEETRNLVKNHLISYVPETELLRLWCAYGKPVSYSDDNRKLRKVKYIDNYVETSYEHGLL